MDAILQVLSGLVMHANPVGTQTHLPYDQFIGIAQLGLVLILVGLAMTGLARSGFPERQSGILAIALVLLSVAYLAGHGGNPFGFAEKACVVAGGIFRFVGGVGVAIGLACLLGMGRASWHEIRSDLINPVVIGATAIYALFSVGAFSGIRSLGTGPQAWAILSIAAVWVSFGGLYGLLRSRLGYHGVQRPLAVVAGGVMLLVLISFVASPGHAYPELAYSGCFPAGVVIGFFGQLAS